MIKTKKSNKPVERTPYAYEVVNSMTGQTVSGQITKLEDAEAFLKERAQIMGKSVYAYFIKRLY